MDHTKALTVVIPVRIDSRERKENLDSVISFFLRETFALVIVLEADKSRQYQYNEPSGRLSCYFEKDDDPIFHRTKYINQLLLLSTTEIVGVWDTDALASLSQIKQSMEHIRTGATISYPYGGLFVFLNPLQSEEARLHPGKFVEEFRATGKSNAMGRPSVGGAFLVNRKRYLAAGGENEAFYGWGPEDAERLKRMEILEEPIARTEGILLHLSHPRGVNSLFDRGKRDLDCLRELLHVCGMNTKELSAYIHSKEWNKQRKAGDAKTSRLKAAPLVSVVMPVYNNEDYVGTAIHSILRQSYQAFEFIIINDGSTDRSAEIIRQEKDNRILFIDHTTNAGNYHRRNEGLKVAKGKYICVMDADDEALPFRLESQVLFLENHPEIVAAGAQFEFMSKGISQKPQGYNMLKVQLLQNNMFLHPSLMIRKNILDTIGGYCETYYYAADYDLACKIAEKGIIVNMPDVLMRYRIHKAQISSSYRKKQSEYADTIRMEYLRRAGFVLTPREKELFTTLMNHSGELLHDPDQRKEIQALMENINKQNKTLNCFDKEVFELFVQKTCIPGIPLHSLL